VLREVWGLIVCLFLNYEGEIRRWRVEFYADHMKRINLSALDISYSNVALASSNFVDWRWRVNLNSYIPWFLTVNRVTCSFPTYCKYIAADSGRII
jgi:hypothetical protein